MGIKRSIAIRLRITFLIAGLLLMSAFAAFGQSRIVAIGDVHGAYPEFVSILQKTGLIDENKNEAVSELIFTVP